MPIRCKKYGDVPYAEKELTVESEELYAARTPRAEAMLKVLEDLTFATQKLPGNWGDGGAPGRINRWGALLVKARVCLYEGTFNKYHSAGESKMWLEEAAKAAAELMDTGPYRIYSTGKPQSDYNAYHRILDLAGNSEVIYWKNTKPGSLTTTFSNISAIPAAQRRAWSKIICVPTGCRSHYRRFTRGMRRLKAHLKIVTHACARPFLHPRGTPAYTSTIWPMDVPILCLKACPERVLKRQQATILSSITMPMI